MQNKFAHSFVLLSFVLAALLQACSGGSVAPTQVPATEPDAPEVPVPDQDSESAQETSKIKVIVQPFVTFLPFHIAQQEGYFAEQGLEVEFVNIQRAQDVLPALSSGEADVSSGLMSAAILNAIARGGQIKIVADKGYADPNACDNYNLVVRSDLVEEGVIATEADLKGHTVDVVPASWLEYYLSKLLEEGGLTLDDIQTSDLPPPQEPEAFAQKAMEMTVNSEPFVTRFAANNHKAILTPPSQLVPGSVAAVVLYGPSLLDNPELGERFMAAYVKALRQYTEGATPRNIELAAEFTQLDAELLEKICWPAMNPTGAVDVQSVLDFQEWAIARDYVETAVTAEQFWDGRFVEKANQQLGE